MPTTAGLVGTWLGTSGVAAAAATAAVGAIATKALAKAPDLPKAPKPIGSVDKPQEQKAVDRSKLLERNSSAAAGALSGNGSTLLTGSGGVNPQTLNLGSSSLLGQ